MDTRLFKYFLAIAEEGNMTRAAEILHVTQPTLSKQLNKLEEMVGTKLFQRTSRQMILTEAGLALRDRAKVILELTEKTFNDLQQNDQEIQGTIKMSVAESAAFREIVKVFKQIHQEHPAIQFDIHSGDAATVTEQLDQGVVDFGLLVGTPNLEKYNTLKLPVYDQWGVLMRKEDPLAKAEAITPDRLQDQPLIVSKQALTTNELSGWLGYSMEDAHILAAYNLINNAVLMAEEGLGYLMSLDKLANTTATGKLAFRPLNPPVEAPLYLIWRRNYTLSAVSALFLETIREALS
jgi:DNA-binding transcriptional LysR family regulator